MNVEDGAFGVGAGDVALVVCELANRAAWCACPLKGLEAAWVDGRCIRHDCLFKDVTRLLGGSGRW